MMDRPDLKRRVPGSRAAQILVIIIVLSVLLRVAAAFYIGNEVDDLPGTADQLSYHHLALRILDGHGLTFGEPWWPATPAGEQTAHWSYLYTAFLVLVYAVFGPNPLVARVIQAVLVGVAQPLLVYSLALQVFALRPSSHPSPASRQNGTAVALASAALIAFYAYFIYYAANLMTESFYITTILAVFWIVFQMAAPEKAPVQTPAPVPPNRDRLPEGTAHGPGWGKVLRLAVLLGLVLGAVVLFRQLFLLIIPFVLLWVVLQGRKQALAAILAGIIVVLMILPFTAYNYSRFGRLVLLNTNAGFAFFWGNHPIYGTHFEPILPRGMGSYIDLIPDEVRHLDEAALDQELLGRGLQFVLDDPGRYILLSISRIPAYFMFWPSSDSGLLSNIARVASFGVLWPFMLYGLLLAVLRWPKRLTLLTPPPVVMLYTFILVYTGIHLLTWALIRYRLPVDAVLVMFAGLALVDLVERVPALRRLVQSLA